jgi:replicative DNA helicase
MAKQPRPEDEAAYQAWVDRMNRIHGVAELIVAKQRHGSTGKVRMKFEAHITKFSDLADDGNYQDDSYE